MITFDAITNAALEEEQAKQTAEAQDGPKPGEITDPVMQDAMAKAKQLHFERTGVQVP